MFPNRVQSLVKFKKSQQGFSYGCSTAAIDLNCGHWEGEMINFRLQIKR